MQPQPKPTALPPSGWVRERTVLAVVPYGRTKLREEVAAGRFPAPKKFSARVIAYDAEAVHKWIADQR
jgi:prophage regulatory protein